MRIITVEEIILIHSKLIEKYGGEKGIINRGELEFIVDWVNSHPEKSIFWKVAILMRGIIGTHPFVDGNKRTGFEIADGFLRMHGYKITASDEEAFNFVLTIAKEEVPLENIIEWLRKNTKKYL